MSLYPQTGQKKVSPQPPSPTPGKKSPLFPQLRRFSRARGMRKKVRNSTASAVAKESLVVAAADPSAVPSSSCSASSSGRSSLSDADHDHLSTVPVRGGEPHSPLRSGISPQTQASMDNVFRFDAEHLEEKIGKAWPHKCCYVVKELLVTERVYVQALGEIIGGYLTPLYSHVLASGGSSNFIKTVFSNIVKIHQLHIDLLDTLQRWCTDPLEFAYVFLRWDFLTMYTVYCTNYSKGNECLERSLAEDESLREFIDHCQLEVGHSLPLSSQLIKPVQRILKYPLLLEELTKHFDCKHRAHRILMGALEKLSSVAEEINKAFTEKKRANKANPTSVARKRTNQIKDLQRSRTLTSRRSPSSSPSHTRYRPSQYGFRGYKPGSAGSSPSHSYLYAGPCDIMHLSLDKIRGHTSDEDAEAKMSVHRLKTFYENLTRQAELEESLTSSYKSTKRDSTLRRASSLANNLKLVGSPESSSSTPSSPSKSPQRRKSSNGLVELISKFGGHGKLKRPPSQVQLNDEVKQQLSGKSPQQSPKRGKLSKVWPPPQPQ